MLAMSQAQLDALAAECSARFISRIQSFVLEQTGHQTPEPLLRDLLVRAQNYGFETEQECATYISVTLLVSNNSGVEPQWVSEVMSRSHVSPDQRRSILCSEAKKRERCLKSSGI